MAELMDIMGYCNSNFSLDFDEHDKWEGQLLLEDDGWFEGIVVDNNRAYKGDRFIFGVYYPKKIIELFKLSPNSVSPPFIFRGRRDAKTYVGKFEVLGLFGSMPSGACSISTQYVESVRKNTDSEMAILKAKIQKYKNELLDSSCKELYYNSLDTRYLMCKMLFARYVGKEFTDEELRKIMDDCQPIYQRVERKTVEKVRRLMDERKKEYQEVFGSDDKVEFSGKVLSKNFPDALPFN